MPILLYQKIQDEQSSKEILTTYKQLEKQILCNRYFKRATKTYRI